MQGDNLDRVLLDERFDLQAIEYDRPRPRLRPAPADYGTPPVEPAEPLTGDCPGCWTEIELNMAGRIKPHGGCPGGGEPPLIQPVTTPYWLTGGKPDA